MVHLVPHGSIALRLSPLEWGIYNLISEFNILTNSQGHLTGVHALHHPNMKIDPIPKFIKSGVVDVSIAMKTATTCLIIDFHNICHILRIFEFGFNFSNNYLFQFQHNINF